MLGIHLAYLLVDLVPVSTALQTRPHAYAGRVIPALLPLPAPTSGLISFDKGFATQGFVTFRSLVFPSFFKKMIIDNIIF